MWRLRHLRTRPAGVAQHLSRAVRTAAPRPGVGRHRRERRRDDHRRQGHGPRHAGVRRTPARAARRPPRDRARPLLHDRFQHVAQRAARVPLGRRRRVRARPQRQPHQHRRARDRARHAARRAHLRQRADRRAPRTRVHRHAALRRPRPRARAREGAAPPRRCVLARADGRGARVRRPRPPRLPPARARPHRGRLGARERDGRARHRGRALRPRRRARRDGRDRRHRRALDPLRRAHPEAVPVRVRLHRASRHAALRPERARRAPAHGRGARAPGAVHRRRHGDAGARVGRPRRAGIRAARPAFPTATAS